MRQRRSKATIRTRATILYVRVSSDDQVATGVSLADQEARLRAYSAAMAWDDPEVILDAGESAKSLQRPGMAILLGRVRRGEIARIAVTKLDRLTRSTRDLADLLDLCTKHDVALVSIAESLDSGSAAGRMVTNMLGVVAQWEREAIAERTASALMYKRRTGQAYSPTPFGYTREGSRLVENAIEQAALAEMRRMDVAGASYREIGRWLTAQGIRPRRGVAWYASTVRAVLRSRMAIETGTAA